MINDIELAHHALACYTDIPSASVKDVEVCISHNSQGVVIAFPGTQINIGDGHLELDAFRDLRCFPWWSRELSGFCHAGFLKGARDILPAVRETVAGEKGSVQLTGHSLGGAIAIVVAALLVRLGLRVDGVTTFGAPPVDAGRCGDILRDAGVRVMRYENWRDMVPEVRFWLGMSKPTGYRWVLHALGQSVAYRDFLQRHKMSEYLARLEAERAEYGFNGAHPADWKSAR